MGGPNFKRKKNPTQLIIRENNSQATLVSTVGLAMKGGAKPLDKWRTLCNINMSTCNHSYQVQGKSELKATILTNGPWMDGWWMEKRDLFHWSIVPYYLTRVDSSVVFNIFLLTMQ
jgi:hypothetical protein